MGIFLAFIFLSIPGFQFGPDYQMLLTDVVKLAAIFLSPLKTKTPSLHRGRERVHGLRPFGAALDLCHFNFDKHKGILFHPSSFVNEVELVRASSFQESQSAISLSQISQ